MNAAVISEPVRRPRFRRAAVLPTFRLTDDDIAIVRHLARHRFLRSTHIAALVGRSLDRTNDRLSGLFHHGYIDRPRAQLDYYPTSGSAPMVYALANRGARLLIERDGIQFANVAWSRKNREAGRPFIEHQLEIVDLYVSLAQATLDRADVYLIHADEMQATFLDQPSSDRRNPFSLRVKLAEQGTVREMGLVPDLAFALELSDGSRRNFMVEIDRGTMPILRTNFLQTSFERKMRAYLTAHAGKLHERFGWKIFRVLTVTTDEYRIRSMQAALKDLHIAHSPGASMFFFATRAELRTAGVLVGVWRDGTGRNASLL
jgi:hypothetical protein